MEALEDHLFAQGLEVMLPAFDGDDADAAALHQDSLLRPVNETEHLNPQDLLRPSAEDDGVMG